VFKAYRSFCINSSLKPIGKTRFYERLERLGYERVTYSNSLYYKIKITEQ